MTFLRWQEFRRPGSSSDEILNAFGVSVPPVPILEIMEELGIRVVVQAGFGLGTLDTASFAPVAVVSPQLTWERRRFVLAHQLGHLMLHPLGRRYYEERNLRGSLEQTEANRFASDLLMPRWMLAPAAQALRYDIEDLAHVFGVAPPVLEAQLFGFV